MNRFEDIIGQEHIKEHLHTSISSGKISHAYLLTGEHMAGKAFIAEIFAQAVMCENRGSDLNPCGSCHSCIQAMSHNHPDIIYVNHSNPGSISVEDIRDKIIKDIALKPYASKYKIYIMNEAEKMTIQAQNALLKTLEEPPEYAVIMLLTTSKTTMLSTILSRCIQLDMRPVEDKLVRQYLMKELKIPDYQADICVAFARGNIGKAKSLAGSDEFEKIKDESIRILNNIKSMDVANLIETLKTLQLYKLNTDEFLDIMMIWYRDILLYKATMDMDSLIFKEEGSQIRKTASQTTYEGIENILDAIEKTKARLKANVNFELAMELMLLTIKEES